MVPPYVKKFAEEVWQTCRKADGDSRYGKPPQILVLREACGANWERHYALAPYSKCWSFDGISFEIISPPEINWSEEEPNGMYWRLGLIDFHIDEVEKRSIYMFTLGPRYARG